MNVQQVVRSSAGATAAAEVAALDEVIAETKAERDVPSSLDEASFLSSLGGDVELAVQLSEMFFDESERLLSSVRALQGQNDWIDWKTYMEMLLDTTGLYEPFIVLGKQLAPSTIDEWVDVISPYDLAPPFRDEDDDGPNIAEATAHLTKIQAAYKYGAKAAHTLIYGGLSDQVRRHVRDIPRNQPFRLWVKLHSLYERDTALSTRQRLAKFLTLRMDDSENVEQFYTKITTAAQELIARREVITDSMIINTIYGGLPKTFLPIKTVLEQNDQLSAQHIIERLRDYEQQAALQQLGPQDNVFNVQEEKQEVCRLFVKGDCWRGDKCKFKHVKLPQGQAPRQAQEQGGGRRAHNGRPPKCFNCNKLGHLARNCRSPKKERAATATAVHQEEAWTFNANDSDNGNSEWVIDSGATRHMAKTNSELENLRASSTQVHLADGTTRDVKQVGDLQLSALRLHDVLFAPMLDKNLLSTAALDDDGYALTQKAGRMLIYDASGKQVASATRRGRLFVLDNEHANTAITSETQLWHRRMGHISLPQLHAAMHECKGVTGISDKEKEVCEGCMMGKMTRTAIPIARSR